MDRNDTSVIATSEDHRDVEHIFRNVRTRVPTISLDTVYRTIATLVDRLRSTHDTHVRAGQV